MWADGRVPIIIQWTLDFRNQPTSGRIDFPNQIIPQIGKYDFSLQYKTKLKNDTQFWILLNILLLSVITVS